MFVKSVTPIVPSKNTECSRNTCYECIVICIYKSTVFQVNFPVFIKFCLISKPFSSQDSISIHQNEEKYSQWPQIFQSPPHNFNKVLKLSPFSSKFKHSYKSKSSDSLEDVSVKNLIIDCDRNSNVHCRYNN